MPIAMLKEVVPPPLKERAVLGKPLASNICFSGNEFAAFGNALPDHAWTFKSWHAIIEIQHDENKTDNRIESFMVVVVRRRRR